jgi:hypothetical protein
MGSTANDPTALTRLEYTAPFEGLLHDGNIDGTLASRRPSRMPRSSSTLRAGHTFTCDGVINGRLDGHGKP